MEKIIVKWEVEDGYIGKSRPQQTVVDVEKYIMSEEEWSELSEEEKQQELSEFVEEDFRQRITCGITDWGI